MTNLNSISSSLSSVETIGRRKTTKASADNLIKPRKHSTVSSSLLWRESEDERYPVIAKHKQRTGYRGTDIYHAGGKGIKSFCFSSETALNSVLVPLLLLTIFRQAIDFLGQIWMQIIINFFTIIFIIVALFGVQQRRISYLGFFSFWGLVSTVWNLIVFCIHSKARDVGVTEDSLSLYTGATSWWHSNGPGCLPYNITSIQPTINILQPNIITGCRLDYHLIESSQATIHMILSFISSVLCCFVISNIRRDPKFRNKNSTTSDKLYRLNNLVTDRTKINPNPYPNQVSSRFGPNSASFRRAGYNKTSSRSSQHSVTSARSNRRKNRPSVDGTLPTPRGSTSSNQRSQRYGSLSSRRGPSKTDRRSDISSLTYGITGDRTSSTQRARLSSLSSAEYLPSYQPPHSSSANLLSSYGEISSIDSYNGRTSGMRSGKNRNAAIKSIYQVNTNPTYSGSRSSVYSHNNNLTTNGNGNNNYDNLSYVHSPNNMRTSESLYGASTSGTAEVARPQKQQIYQQYTGDSIGRRSGSRIKEQPTILPNGSTSTNHN